MTRYSAPQLQEELTLDEGLRLKPYIDTMGKTSIGIGRNLSDVGISADEATYLYNNDLRRAEALLDQNLGWWRDLDDVRQRVLLNLAFNMSDKLLTFQRALAAMKAHEWQLAHDQLLNSVWALQVGDRAKRLAQMILTGETA